MIRSILLPLNEIFLQGPAFEHAADLARAGATVTGIYVLDTKSLEVPVIGTPEGFVPTVLTPPVPEGAEVLERMRRRGERALEEFSGLCRAQGLAHRTLLASGLIDEAIARYAVAVDLVVISKAPGTSDLSESETCRLIALIIKLAARPVMVVAERFRTIRRVLIAFDGSPPAGRVLQVVPALAARASCFLVNISAGEQRAEEILSLAEQYLSSYNVSLTRKMIIESKPAEAILQASRELEIDLLVMGAYGHNPLREMIFGSTTEKVLKNCNCPAVLQS